VNELLRIVGKYDPFKGVLMCREVRKGVIRRVGNGHVTLAAAAFKPYDDVFLQHVVVFESLCAGCKQVDMAESRMP